MFPCAVRVDDRTDGFHKVTLVGCWQEDCLFVWMNSIRPSVIENPPIRLFLDVFVHSLPVQLGIEGLSLAHSREVAKPPSQSQP